MEIYDSNLFHAPSVLSRNFEMRWITMLVQLSLQCIFVAKERNSVIIPGRLFSIILFIILYIRIIFTCRLFSSTSLPVDCSLGSGRETVDNGSVLTLEHPGHCACADSLMKHIDSYNYYKYVPQKLNYILPTFANVVFINDMDSNLTVQLSKLDYLTKADYPGICLAG